MSFSDDIQKLSERYQRRMRATVQESTQRTAEIAQKVGPSVANPDASAGGRLPVSTGFLRSSFGAQLNQPPSGPTDNPSGRKFPVGSSVGTGEPLVVILAKWQPGQDIFLGWSARYSRAIEARYAFARGAAEKWPDTVRTVANEVRRRI